MAIAPFTHTPIEVPQSAIGLDGAIALTLLNSLNQSDCVLWMGDRFTYLCSGSDRSLSKCDRVLQASDRFIPHTAIEVPQSAIAHAKG